MIRGGEESREQVNAIFTHKGWKRRRNALELYTEDKSGDE